MFILAISGLSSMFREVFTNIDEGVFWLFEKILVNVFNLAGVTIFRQDIIDEVLNRIYIILGLFILFRLAFSIITYIISPDAISDKDKGFGQIITRVIIALSLLVLTPSIFSYARRAQNFILPVIPRIIVGKDFSSEIETGAIDQSNLENIAKGISFQTYMVIFNYNEYCNDTKNTIIGSEGASTDTVEVANIQHVQNVVSKPCTSPNTEYRYRYIPFIGTLLGCFLVYMMLGISIDIAVRSIKLGLLQLLAPIPIMSYVDPKASKDGAFANWVKNSISTYIDLFARISIVYLIIFLIEKLFHGKIIENNGIFVWVSIVVGLFFFAKKAPQFIKDILGIKGDASMFKDVMTGHGLAGLAGGIIGGSINAKKKGGSALVGGLSGLTASGKQFFSNAAQGKSGGILKAANKAGEESQKLNTGWRGGLNRSAGSRYANSKGFTEQRINALKSESSKIKSQLLAAQAAINEADNPEKRQAAVDKYRELSDYSNKVEGRLSKVKSEREKYVSDLSPEEKMDKYVRTEKRAAKEKYNAGRNNLTENYRNRREELNNQRSENINRRRELDDTFYKGGGDFSEEVKEYDNLRNNATNLDRKINMLDKTYQNGVNNIAQRRDERIKFVEDNPDSDVLKPNTNSNPVSNDAGKPKIGIRGPKRPPSDPDIL